MPWCLPTWQPMVGHTLAINLLGYLGQGHFIWNAVYARTDIYPWLFSQHISDRSAP